MEGQGAVDPRLALSYSQRLTVLNTRNPWRITQSIGRMLSHLLLTTRSVHPDGLDSRWSKEGDSAR